MKSGIKKKKIVQFQVTLQGQLSWENYQHAHADSDCKGQWGFLTQENVPYNFDSLGIVMLPRAVYVACSSCSATYFVPGFEQFCEMNIAWELIMNRRLLSQQEVRFLRLVFDLTQKDIADFLKTHRTYYAKMESRDSGVALSLSDQVRLKLFYAKRLGLNEPEKIYDLIDIKDQIEGTGIIRLSAEKFNSFAKDVTHQMAKMG